jgi:hypothetical protein
MGFRQYHEALRFGFIALKTRPHYGPERFWCDVLTLMNGVDGINGRDLVLRIGIVMNV